MPCPPPPPLPHSANPTKHKQSVFKGGSVSLAPHLLNPDDARHEAALQAAHGVITLGMGVMMTSEHVQDSGYADMRMREQKW